MTKIKTGIIGTGFIGPAHVEALRRLGFVEVAAVAERGRGAGPGEGRAAVDSQGVRRLSSELLADPEIQVVHNCTPNHLHFAINKEILAAKKHIISEKPLAMNSTESRELVRLAKEAGVVHAINFNYRYMPLVQQAHQMCQAAGDVGRIYAVHGSYLQDWLLLENDWNWRLVPELSGESRAVADVGSHWCDLVQFITGLKIVRVMADLVTIHPMRKRPKVEVETYAGKVLRPEDLEDVPINTEDYGSILLEFDSGAHGVADREPMRGRAEEPAVLRNRRQQVRARLEPGAAERAVGRPPRRTEPDDHEGPQPALPGGPRIRPLPGRPQRRLSRRPEELVPQRVRLHRRHAPRRRLFHVRRRPQRDRDLRRGAQELAREAVGGRGVLSRNRRCGFEIAD